MPLPTASSSDSPTGLPARALRLAHGLARELSPRVHRLLGGPEQAKPFPVLLPLLLLIVVWSLLTCPLPIRWPDSEAYLHWPDPYILPGGYWVMGARPPFFPWLLKVVGAGQGLLVFQLLASLIAWAWLGSLLRGGLGVLLGLLLAASPMVWQWHAMVLTESITLTGWILLIALTRQGLVTGRWTYLLAWGLVGAALAWTRDSNAYGLPFLALVLLGRRPRQALACLVLSALLLVQVGAEVKAEQRWVYPVGNVITGRILPDAHARQWFETRGMPTSPATAAVAGVFGTRSKVELEKTAPEFMAWLRSEGLATYQRYLLTHLLIPPSTLLQAWESLKKPLWLCLRYYRIPDGPEFGFPLPVLLAHGVYLLMPPLPLWGLLGLGLLVWAVLWRRQWLNPKGGAGSPRELSPCELSPRELSPLEVSLSLNLGVALLALSQAFLSFHGDAMEVARHLLPSLVLLRVSFWLTLDGLARLGSQHLNGVTEGQ